LQPGANQPRRQVELSQPDQTRSDSLRLCKRHAGDAADCANSKRRIDVASWEDRNGRHKQDTTRRIYDEENDTAITNPEPHKHDSREHGFDRIRDRDRVEPVPRAKPRQQISRPRSADKLGSAGTVASLDGNGTWPRLLIDFAGSRQGLNHGQRRW
jgi:hypothetical protein